MPPRNDKIAEITTLEEANAAWESFFGRFFSPEIPAEVNISFDGSLRQFTPRTNSKAKYNHPSQTSERILHSDDFDDFLNGNTITIPENITLSLEGLEQVEYAIENGDYQNECLKKEEHVFYALWLFKQNKITRQQMTTILSRAQFTEEYPIVNTFQILDHQGQFTDMALKVLIPTIKLNAFGGRFSDWHIERLRLLIQASPKSEQIFYISKANPKIISPFPGIHLGDALYRNKAWYQVKLNNITYDLSYSFGVTEAIQIANRGINGAAASRAKIGKIGVDGVKEGVDYFYRPTAISINNSGVEATTKMIHEYPYSPMPAVTVHDVFHSKLHNTINPEFHMMLNHMYQVIYKHTRQKWSKTMWTLVDREFHAYQYEDITNANSAYGAKIVQKMFQSSRDIYLFWNSDTQELSDDGFIIFWDMITNSDTWKKLYKIDITEFDPPFSETIKKLQTFKEKIGSDPIHPKLLMLKYRYFCVSTQVEFKKICKLLDSLKDNLLTDNDQKLLFGKVSDRNIKNLTILKLKNFEKKILITQNSVKQLLPVFINKELISLFGKPIIDELKASVQAIANEFKSTYQNSKFSKESLDETMINFTKLTEKIDFLEMCYEEIIHSQKYKRRNPITDTIFTFFKNPLTTSQRKHIIVLKEKLDEIIHHHEANLSSEDKEQFQWYMKKRGSNLILCNTERFYLHLDSSVPSKRL